MKYSFHNMQQITFALLGLLVLGKQQVVAQAFPWKQASQLNTYHERIDLRNRFSKQYENKDGSSKLITSIGSMHYRTEKGWSDIDLSIKKNEGSNKQQYPYCNTENSFKTFYPSNLNGQILTQLREGSMTEKMEAVFVEDALGHLVYEYKPNASAQIKSFESQLEYQHLFPSANVQYVQQSDGRKFNLMVESAQFANGIPANSKYIVIQESLEIPSSWVLKHTDLGYELYDGHTWLAHLQQPIASEQQAGSVNETANGQRSQEGEITASQHGNKITIQTKFKVEWLKDPELHYPVYLDPSMVYYPDSVLFATGNIVSSTGAKTNGNIRLASTGSVAWSTFNISGLPTGATILEGHYWGYHFNGIGSINKIASIVGLQSINPIPIATTGVAIYNQIITTGPLYDSNYVFGGSMLGWHSDTINSTGLLDIASQQPQGWTALGFKYHSGYVNTMIQYGYNATMFAYKPFLELDFTTGPCSGAPTPGNTIANTINPCPLDSVFLSIQNYTTTGSGVTFQWNDNAGPISGATDAFYSTSVTSSNTFSCDVTCTLSGLSTTSTPITITPNTFYNCYCTSMATGNMDEEIYNVTVNGASTNTLYSFANGCTTAAPGPGSVLSEYSNFKTLGSLTSLTQGALLPFSVTENDCDGAPYFNNAIGIWIDFNHNGSFMDPGENVYVETIGSMGPRTANGNMMIPTSALLGSTVMRVVCTESVSILNPCGLFAYGETEDYFVDVVAPPPCTGAPSPGNTLAANSSICAGNPVQLSLQNSMAMTGLSYQWYNSSGLIPGANGPTYTTTPTAPNTYYCAVTCTNSGMTTNSTPITITLLNTTIGSGNMSTCNTASWNGNTYTQSGAYTATFTSAAGCDSVFTMNITINSNTTSSSTVSSCSNYTLNGQTYTSTGTYVQLFTNSLGCDSILTLNLSIAPIDTSTSVTGNTIHANANGVSYQWIDCGTGSLLAGATNQNYTPSSNGSYAVVLVSVSCTDTSLCVPITSVGVHDIVPKNVTVYPNPTTGKFYIELTSDAQLTIRSITGEIVFETKAKKGKKQIDISDKAKGIYILQIEGLQDNVVMKLIYEK